MSKTMLIDAAHAEETRVAIVDGRQVEEFDFESKTKRQLRGNIYLAKVTRVEPSPQAAFVEYGGNRHGFLAFNEIHPDYYQIPVADRATPVELSGTTLDGDDLDVADLRGDVVVLNVWASWCGPCQAEAPVLEEVHERTKKDGVRFVGIDYREPAANGRAQAEAWGHTFPSISDEAGTSAVALQGKVASQPTTIVLDEQGRIAAVVRGAVERSTLLGLIEDASAG
mgnify:CR=1 FL=1